MEKLNELVYRAEGYLRTKADIAPEQINVSCETILAIAEAFRALEQRAEAAEAAEAKLAELEKQAADGKWIVQYSATEEGYERYSFASWRGNEPKNNTELFTRPAPAINRAELVLDENDNPQGFTDWYEHHFATQPYKGASHVTDCENAWRAAILRKIEQAK